MDEQLNQEIAQLYVAMFGRAPDAEGFGFWVGLREQGQAMAQVADAMFGTAPARTYFPNGMSNEDVIASFYLNVLGREADAEGLAYWTAKLNLPGATPGSVITEMIEVIANYEGTDPDGIASAELFNGRAAAAQFFGEHVASGDAPPFLFGQAGASSGPQLVVEADASGVVDAAGYGVVSIGALSGNLSIINLAQGATLSFRDQPADLVPSGNSMVPEWSITCVLAAPGGSDDMLRIELDGADAIYVGTVVATGVEYLSIVASGQPQELWDENALYFAQSEFHQVTVSGEAAIGIYGLEANAIDATGFQHALSLWGGEAQVVLGGTGGDIILLTGNGASGHGGAGDDLIAMLSGAVVANGGSGADSFTPAASSAWFTFMTIEDFTPGEDRLSLWDVVGAATMDATTWHSSALAMSAGSSFTECLDVAASMREIGAASDLPISWFQFSGDTFIVVDQSQSEGFVSGVDQVVKLSGLVDLSGLSLGWSSIIPFFLS